MLKFKAERRRDSDHNDDGLGDVLTRSANEAHCSVVFRGEPSSRQVVAAAPPVGGDDAAG